MNDAPMSRMKPIVPAKLTRPSTRGALFRERLFHSIKGDREKKVNWISGPAGSGKTTLAASYLGSQKGPCLWYQLDEGDADLATFFYYLGLAAKNATPRNRKPLPLLTPEYLQSIPIFAKRFFEQLAARLTGGIRSRSSLENGSPVIVFDNYQDVPEDSMFQAVLNAGLSSLPQGVNVIILSRSEPPPAYARLRAAGEMSLLGWEDIRLTVDESNAIAMLKTGTDLPGKTLSRLYQTTNGWVAGLVLLMESRWIEDFDLELSRGLQQEEIFGYFATELFDRRPREDQTFLLETSFLPKMNARMAEELTGNARARRIFSDLNRKNYFINRYASPGHTFQYHSLFREFLRAKAEETLPPEHLQQVRRRAAIVLEGNGWGEDAVNLLCEAKEWSEATRMILSCAPGLISQGRWQTMQGWIHSLPEAVREQTPWLLFWMGVCLLHSCPAGSQDAFARSLEKFKNGGDAAGSFLALSGMFDAITQRSDSFFEFDRLIPMMNELLQEYPQFPSPQIEAHVVNSMLCAFFLRQPNNPALPYWEGRGFSLARDIPDKDMVLRILLALLSISIFSGNLEKAGLILDSFQKKIEASLEAPLAVLLLKNIHAMYYWLSIDFEKSRRAVDDGVALAEHTGIHFFNAYLLGHGAAGSLCIGEVERAEQYLEKMQSALQMVPSAWAEGYYHAMMAWCHLLRGNPARSAMHADLGISFSTASGSPQTSAYSLLIKAMAMHDLKDDDTARVHLCEIQKICSTIDLYLVEFMTFLIEAQIAFDNGDEVSGRYFLQKAMVLGRKHGYANGYFWVNSTMARLCVKALEAGIETDYVQSLIRKRNLIPDKPFLHLENWPWPFKIYTLGQFEMVRDGEVVTFLRKVQQRPLLLLKALIAFGGKDVKEEHLCDALWPDAEGDQAHRSFETTLYRLRQLIGKDKAVNLKEGRLTLNMQSCWVDAFALEQVLSEAEGLWEPFSRCQADPRRLSRDAATQAIQLTRKAITLYQGHFLEVEPEQTWLLSPQERLRSKYIRGITTLASHWEAALEPEMAIECYEKALEVDDLAEECYQHLMLCHQQLGRRAKAIAVYGRCRSVLGARLGMEPSARTEALLATLRSRR
jgi:LuxR family transcriptional regulator, maltose regulon positive regulatory protein